MSLPHTEYAVATYYVLAVAEASSNLARYDGVKYGFRAAGKNLMEIYLNTRTQGFGAEVQAPHHAGHLYPVGRLL